MVDAIEARIRPYDASSGLLCNNQDGKVTLVDWPTVIQNAIVSLPASSSETSSFEWSPSPTAESQRQSPYVFDLCKRLHASSWESAGARVPQELFDDIIFYLDSDLLENQPWYTDTREGKPVGKSLKTCLLVCRHWANLCRQRMVLHTTIKICSPEEADTFIQYAAVRGCPALEPLHKMIRGIIVEQRYGVSRSFCHRFHIFKSNTPIRRFLRKLELTGPIPHGFPSYTLDTPHWSLPCFIVTPPSLLPFREIVVRKLHLPSYVHVTKYIRHLTHAGSVSFDGLTWDSDVGQPDLPMRIHRRNSPKYQSSSSLFHASECTDNFRVCLEIALTHRGSPIHKLGDDDSANVTLYVLGAIYIHINRNRNNTSLSGSEKD